jgi:hypothetical protein
MTTSTRAPSLVRTNSQAYDNFGGLDTSRADVAMDVGKSLHLVECDNAFCDWRGQIVRDPAAKYRVGRGYINHIRFIDRDVLVWAEQRAGAIYLVSENEDGSGSHTKEAFPTNAIVSSTHFNNRVHFAAQALPIFDYDGTVWRQNQSPTINNILRPAYLASVQRRMVCAGILGAEQEVHLSRVDEHEIWPDDEDPASEDVERAGTLTVRNLAGVAGRVTGIAPFEQTKLAIFTEDRAFLYNIDPDLEKWFLDDRANINIGCLSHNTIVPAGDDLLYCSRSGVHSIRRSEDNGIMVNSQHYSDRVNILYRALLAQVDEPERISAAFDQDRRQYHIFFPMAGGVVTKRLTLTMNPEAGGELTWSTGTYLNARCGTFYGGNYVIGTSGGIFDVADIESTEEDLVEPQMQVTTPVLWGGDITNQKQGHSWTLMASGPGVLEVEAFDEQDKKLDSWVMEITGDEDDNRFIGVPLSRQYTRKFESRFTGVRFRFRTKSKGLVRIVGFTVNTR